MVLHTGGGWGKKKELIKRLKVISLSKRDTAKYTSGINWVLNRNTHYVLWEVQKNVWVIDSHWVGTQNLGRLWIWVGYYGISRLLTETGIGMLLSKDYSIWANQTHLPKIQQRTFLGIYMLTQSCRCKANAKQLSQTCLLSLWLIKLK